MKRLRRLNKMSLIELENEFLGYLREDLKDFLSAVIEHNYNKDKLSKEIKEVINKIDNINGWFKSV